MQENDPRETAPAIRRGRTAMLVSGCAAAVLLAALAVQGRLFILEQWHLLRLGSKDPETRTDALAWLAEKRSERAVGRLVELIATSLVAPMVCVTSGTLDEYGIDLEEEGEGENEEDTPWFRIYGAAIPFLTGPAAVEPLRSKLRAADPKERVVAACLLGKAGPIAIEALEDLLERSEVDPVLAWPAAAALGRIAWEDPEGTRKMAEKVRRGTDRFPLVCMVHILCGVHERARGSSGETGERVASIVWEALVDAVRNGEPKRRALVLDCIGKAIDLESTPEAVDLLESAAGDPDPEVREKAREHLEDLREE